MWFNTYAIYASEYAAMWLSNETVSPQCKKCLFCYYSDFYVKLEFSIPQNNKISQNQYSDFTVKSTCSTTLFWFPHCVVTLTFFHEIFCKFRIPIQNENVSKWETRFRFSIPQILRLFGEKTFRNERLARLCKQTDFGTWRKENNSSKQRLANSRKITWAFMRHLQVLHLWHHIK